MQLSQLAALGSAISGDPAAADSSQSGGPAARQREQTDLATVTASTSMSEEVRGLAAAAPSLAPSLLNAAVKRASPAVFRLVTTATASGSQAGASTRAAYAPLMSDIEVVKEALSKAVVRTVLGTKAQLASDAFKKQAEHVGLRKWTTVKIAHLVGYKDEAKIGGLAFLDSPKKAAGTATGDCPLGEQAPNALFLISTSKLHKLYSASNWREDDVSENLQGCVDKCMEAHGAGIS